MGQVKYVLAKIYSVENLESKRIPISTCFLYIVSNINTNAERGCFQREDLSMPRHFDDARHLSHRYIFIYLYS